MFPNQLDGAIISNILNQHKSRGSKIVSST